MKLKFRGPITVFQTEKLGLQISIGLPTFLHYSKQKSTYHFHLRILGFGFQLSSNEDLKHVE